VLIAMLSMHVAAQSSSSPAFTTRMDAAKVKQKLSSHGVGQWVRITTTERTDVRGTIITIGDSSVTLQYGRKPPVVLAYSDVSKVHGPGIGNGVKVGITAGVVLALVAIVAAVI
jgi:hypothetical protein